MRFPISIALAVTACRVADHPGPGKGAAPRAQPAAATIDAAAPPAPDLAKQLATLGARRKTELEAATPRRQPVEGEISALGPCTRPTAAEQAAIETRVHAWIAHVEPRAHVDADAISGLRFGCVEPAGVTVDAQADLTYAPSRRTGWWWTLRVTPRAIDLVSSASGCALIDCMEWSDEQSVSTIAEADLDHDGTFDLVLGRDHHEGGAHPHITALSVVGAAAHPSELGEHADVVELARWQPPPSEATVVLALTTRSADAPTIYRCVTAGPVWTACPAAERARRVDEAIDAADELATGAAAFAADRDRLADALALLDVPQAERDALIAEAAPSSFAAIVARFAHDRAAVVAGRTAAEQEAVAAAADARLASKIRDALGEPACASPSPAERRAATAAIRASITRHGGEADELTLGEACIGSGRAYWVATWSDGRAQQARSALVYITSAGVTRPIELSTVLDPAPEGQGRFDATTNLEAKFYAHDGSIVALVATGEHGKLWAVVDGAITGTRDGSAQVSWQTIDPDDHELVYSNGDTLARSEESNHITYWHATAAGVVAAATFDRPGPRSTLTSHDALGRMLEDGERAWMSSVVGQPPVTAKDRADALAAMANLGAPKALLDEAAAAP
jgi:hypothetical protein